MKKFIISIISMLLFIIFVFVISFTIFINVDDKYIDTYYGELKDKTDRLDNIKEDKIVFIGGSSLSFGIRSDELEKALGMPVSSYGLYASLGTKVMMELALDSIKDGDIVIIAPEISDTTYSTVMNYNNILKCFEGNSLYKRLAFNYELNLLYNYPKFAISKMNMAKPIEERPYTKDSFNEYGEIIPDLVNNNIMINYYDSGQMIEPNIDLIDSEFINYLNSYNKKVKKKNAKLYFSFSPTNNKALNSDGLIEFENKLKDELDFDILGRVSDYTYNELYFYDTNYHLNYSGSLMHTKKLSENLANELNIEIKEEVNTISVPEPLYINEGSITVDGLTYTKTSNSYYITGYTTELGNPTKLTIPSELFGLPVIGLDDECFKDLDSLEAIYINDPFMSFGANCFKGCSNLKAIYLNTSKAPAVPSAGLVTGASDEIAIYIPKSLVRNYTSGYAWMAYLDYIKTY